MMGVTGQNDNSGMAVVGLSKCNAVAAAVGQWWVHGSSRGMAIMRMALVEWQ